MKRSVGFLVCLAAILSICVVWIVRARTAQSTTAATTSDPGVVATPHSAPRPQHELDAGARVEQRQAHPFVTRVVDRHGQPIVGAEVRWIPTRPEFLSASVAWPDLDWSAIDLATRTFTTGPSGIIELPSDMADPVAVGSTIWVLRPGFRAREISLEFPKSVLALPDTITLEECGSLTAHVVDRAGRAVAGAAVVQYSDLRRDDLSETTASPRLARRWLRVVSHTDARGAVKLPAIDGGQVVFATDGELQSERWAGSDPATLRLVLMPTFTLVGEVSVADGSTLPVASAVRWVVETADELRLQTRLRVAPDRTFGPVRLPRVPARQYFFQLEAPGCAMGQIARALPDEGAEVRLRFEVGPSVDVAVRVVDSSGQPIDNALVIGNTSMDGVWCKVERTTDSDGLVRFRSTPPGMFWVRARKHGFVGRLLESIDVSASLNSPILVQLERAGRIQGRVTHATAPVRDFMLRYWRDDPNEYNQFTATDSPDGRFEIDEAPVGTVVILASSDSAPSPPPVRVECTAEGGPDVEIELPAAIEGHGRVVDARSGEPVAAATVQLWSATTENRIRPWRQAFPVSSNGEFAISGFAPGITACDVTAPGYAQRKLTVFGTGASSIDLGWIGLVHQQALEVQIVPEDGVDVTRYAADLTGGRYIDSVPFPRDGRLRFEHLEPGAWNLRVLDLAAGVSLFEVVEVPVGHDAQLRIPVGGRRLSIEVELERDEPLVPGTHILAFWTRADGRAHQQAQMLQPDMPVQLFGIDSDRVTVTVVDPDGQPRCVRLVEFDASGPERIVIALHSTKRLLRVVDRDRAPIAGAAVLLTTHPNATNWLSQLTTDVRGECSISGYEVEPLFVALYHPSHGLLPSHRLGSQEAEGTTTELVLDVAGDVAIRLLERDRPAPGVRVVAEDIQTIAWGLYEAFTNSEGVARWGPAAAGDYVVRVQSPGWWPVTTTLRTTASSSIHDIQARRVGSVTIEVRDNLGHALRDVPLALRSIELSQSVEEWVRGGQINSSDPALRTDSDGRLRLDGLPNGEFEWTAQSPEHEQRSGRFIVPAHSMGVAVIELR